MQLNRAFRSARANRVLFFVLVLTACCQQPAGAQSSFWPIKWETDLNAAEIQTDGTQTSPRDLIFSVDTQTRIVADEASTNGELFVSGDSTGISARLKAMEDELEDIRQEYNTMMSLDSLETAKTDCDTAKDSLTARIAALEKALDNDQADVPYALRPPKCDADGVAGLRRELNGQNVVWTCPCANNYTSSATDTCDIASCALPATVVSDTHIVQNCATTHLKAGAVCEFSCEAGHQPTGLNHDTPGQITCGASGGSPTSTATSCTACTNSFSGENCKLESCDLEANGFNNDTNKLTNAGDPCPTQYMIAGTDCKYDCTNDSMPSDVSTVNTPGTITCAADGGATTPAAPACTSCDAAGFLGYTGDNCKLASCDISGFQSDLNVVANTGDPCPSSVSYMIAGTDCDYDCASGYMPSSETAVDRTGTITCHASAGTTTPAAPTCVTCDAAGFTGHSGDNCKIPPCDLNANGFNNDLEKLSNADDPCPARYMIAGEDCKYDCTSGYMPSAETDANTPGTITCAAAGTTTIPASPACVACSTKTGLEYHTGENCKLAPCDLSTAGNGFNDATNTLVNADDPCPARYLVAGENCKYDCASGFMPSAETNANTPGTIFCVPDGTTATTPAAPTCVACSTKTGLEHHTGKNCKIAPCDLEANGFNSDTNKLTNAGDPCPTQYLVAGEDCKYDCASGFMPSGVSAVNTAGTISCTVGADGITATTAPATPTCVACGTGNAAFTDYTGINCQTPACNVTDVINDLTINTNKMIDSDCGSTMKASGTCTYSCDAGFMPTGLTNVGVSRTLTCTAGGGTITATGYTAGTDAPAPACTACTNGSNQVNCVLQPGTG